MNDDVREVNQAQSQTQQVPLQSAQPAVPIGSVNKEVGMIASIPELQHAGAEVSHDIDQELKDLGVEEKKDSPDLTPKHQELGIAHAGPSAPVSAPSSGRILLPMSEKEVTDKLKTGGDDDSGKILAKLIKKVMKILGL